MKEYLLKLFGITPDLGDKFESLKERQDHLRMHITRMEEKLERIEQAITFLLNKSKE